MGCGAFSGALELVGRRLLIKRHEKLRSKKVAIYIYTKIKRRSILKNQKLFALKKKKSLNNSNC